MSAGTFPQLNALESNNAFVARHLGPDEVEQKHMLSAVGAASRQALMDAIVPASIARTDPMDLPLAISETQALAELKAIASRNRIFKSFIGQGYHSTLLPTVILRNILENPGWYTSYTPYQAEISQGRMEALVNFQTMVTDLTGMDIANASLLDEATAAAEAMTLARRSVKSGSNMFVVDQDCHAQTIAVIRTRAEPLGIDVQVGDVIQLAASTDYFGVLVQYPGSTGQVHDWRDLAQVVHGKSAALCVAADPLALTLLAPPGEWGADIVIGSAQRFGTPMGNGGPHAAFMACKDAFKRSMPGRIVGVSIDSQGNKAYRLALQTREQHIRREKATSNICTAQALLAIINSMYAVYHGPQGLKRIAQRVASYTAILAQGLQQLGHQVAFKTAFDTITVNTGKASGAIVRKAAEKQANLRHDTSAGTVSISLDETTTRSDIILLWEIFASEKNKLPKPDDFSAGAHGLLPQALLRTSEYLTHPVFNSFHSETAMLRYMRSLSDKDLALDRCMIPLGSCTMKLNATSEMIPITWPEFADIHPFAPEDQRQGYVELDAQLRRWLSQATGYADVSLQPNSGASGEYAGLLAIRAWHIAQGHEHRDICLIPSSAHGTNPASAAMAGLKVVVTACDNQGNVDVDDLRAKCEEHKERLAAVMITYPSTHGVFETRVKEICEMVHQYGGRIYVDGANMNALVGLAAPGAFGGDVSHLNLHKTFAIPHGGGGPGVGPVCVVEDLVPFLPGRGKVGQVSSAPMGSASVTPITWMYFRMMGAAGLTAATQVAILNANYISQRLKDHYPTLYASDKGYVAHECILDIRPIKNASGIDAEDVAKRLIDYGFHAPTLSFPVAGTLMVEPTESEPLHELDRFIDAMIAIREEVRKVENGTWPREDNPLVHAPHTVQMLAASDWKHPYTREEAAYPLPSLRHNKYFAPVGRVDNVWGDRNLFCSCIPAQEWAA